MTQPGPPPGGAIYSPNSRGGGSFRPVAPTTERPPVLPRATPGRNPFARSGTSVAAQNDPMARRFDALSRSDQVYANGLERALKSGKISVAEYSRVMQRLLIDENPYGPTGSLPGEAGFFPPRPGPSPAVVMAGRVGSILAPAADFAAVLNQINQTSRVISGAPAGAQGSMTLDTMGTVGAAASAAGAAATGLPLSGVAGIGIAGAAVPMAAATAFGAASGQEGSDPWGGIPHPGIGVAGPKASDPVRRAPTRAPSVEDFAPQDMPDHHAIGFAHGVAMGEHIKKQVADAAKKLPAALNDHLQKQMGG